MEVVFIPRTRNLTGRERTLRGYIHKAPHPCMGTAFSAQSFIALAHPPVAAAQIPELGTLEGVCPLILSPQTKTLSPETPNSMAWDAQESISKQQLYGSQSKLTVDTEIVQLGD